MSKSLSSPPVLPSRVFISTHPPPGGYSSPPTLTRSVLLPISTTTTLPFAHHHLQPVLTRRVVASTHPHQEGIPLQPSSHTDPSDILTLQASTTAPHPTPATPTYIYNFVCAIKTSTPFHAPPSIGASLPGGRSDHNPSLPGGHNLPQWGANPCLPGLCQATLFHRLDTTKVITIIAHRDQSGAPQNNAKQYSLQSESTLTPTAPSGPPSQASPWR